jgi:tape measure domain-containing protein
MASRNLGALTVDLLLEMGGFKGGMDKAAREADKTASKMRGLAREGERLAQSLVTPLEKAASSVKRYKELLDAGAISQETFARATKSLTDAYNAQSPAVQKANAMLAEGARLTKTLQTPLEQYRATLSNTRELLRAGAISQETYNRAVRDAKSAYQSSSAAQQLHNKLMQEGRALTVSLRTPQEQLTASLKRYAAMLKTGAIDQATFNRAVAKSKAEFAAATTPIKNATSSLSRLQSILAGGVFVSMAKSVLDARVRFESLNATLKSVTGTQAAASAEFQFAAQTARELGLNFDATVGAFTRFTAAAKGTALEGAATRDIFTAVAQASRVLGLSASDTEGVFLALGQMISKGTVQAEELRGQLGERLPGAFQLAAKAMGVTTAELGKMLQKGEVAATDLLPKLAAELQKTFGPGSVEAAKTLGASVERLTTQWQNLKTSLADAVPFRLALTGLENFIGGIAVLLGNALDPADALELKIRDIQKAIAITKQERGSIFPNLFGENEDEKIRRLNAELAQLLKLQNEYYSRVPAKPPSGAPSVLSLDDSAKGAKLFEATRTAAEKFKTEMVELDRLLSIQAITPEVYQRGVAKLREELSRPVKRGGLSEAAKEMEESLRRQASAYQAVLENGLAAMEGLRTPLEEQIAQYQEAKFALEELAATYPNLADQAEAALKRLELSGFEDITITAEKIFPPEEVEKLSEFALEAKRNVQDLLGDFLAEPFSRGLDGLVEDFGKTMQRIAAQAVAAKLADKLFGGFETWFDKLGGLFGGAGGGGGILASIGSFFGFAGGGYTGDGGKYQPAGIVHKGEGVLSQREVRAIGGPSGFHALRESINRFGADLIGGLPGYADGGYVGAMAGASNPYSAAAMRGAPVSGARGEPVTLYQTFAIQAPQGSVSRATQQQIGAQAYRGAARAASRNA